MIRLANTFDPRIPYAIAAIALSAVLVLGTVDFIKEHNKITDEEE